MGSLQAMEMASFGGVNKHTIHWHLTANHYPPHPEYMVAPALEAIDACARGEGETLITLPNEAEHRVYGNEVPAWVIVDGMHLEAFVEAQSEA